MSLNLIKFKICLYSCSWDFSTIDHDIRFGIKSVDNKTGESHSEVPLTRVISNEMDEAGYITCRGGTKCKNFH